MERNEASLWNPKSLIDDLLWAEFAPGTVVAGCFTTSATRAAPVRWCETALAGGRARALVVNAGNANAFTGPTGARAVAAEVDGAAAVLGCAREEVFVASTGVIGVPEDICSLRASRRWANSRA